MGKKQTTELATISASDFAITAAADRLPQLIEENFGAGGMQRADIDRISIPAGGGTAWEIPGLEGAEHITEIECVILAMRYGRVYWEQSFDETGGGMPPDCSSADTLVGVGNPGGDCKICDLSQFHENDRPACRLQCLLLIARKTDQLPLIVQLPVTSIPEVRQFMTRLTRAAISRFETVVAIGLETHAKPVKHSRATFRRVASLDQTSADLMRKISAAVSGPFSAAPIVDEPKPEIDPF